VLLLFCVVLCCVVLCCIVDCCVMLVVECCVMWVVCAVGVCDVVACWVVLFYFGSFSARGGGPRLSVQELEWACLAERQDPSTPSRR